MRGAYGCAATPWEAAEMPRRSAADVAFGTAHATLQPPDHLNELERAEFVALVLSVEPGHFRRSDLPLIEAFVRATVAERRASGELDAMPVTADGKPSPWLPVWLGALRATTTLARRLGLGVAGRAPSKLPEDKTEISYYEKMNLLEGRRDDERN
jgi:hypothetical protein